MLPPDTTQNNPTSIIHQLQSCHFLLFFLCGFFILCTTELQGAHLPFSHVNLSAFLKHHGTYLQDNEKIKLCGVARAFVQISQNGPWSTKFGHPGSKLTKMRNYKKYQVNIRSDTKWYGSSVNINIEHIFLRSCVQCDS